MPRVPNQFPARPASYRLAFVGEAPGQDEERLGVPFIGSSGKLLDAHLDAIPGLSRASCFVGNVCQHRPPGGNEFWRFPTWQDERIQAGIVQLLADLTEFQPNLVVCLGNVPLHLFRHGNADVPHAKTGFQWPSAVTKWRGSLFLAHPSLQQDGHAAVSPWKCLSTLHPAFIIRQWSGNFPLHQDLLRARAEAGDPRLVLDDLDIQWGPATVAEAVDDVPF